MSNKGLYIYEIIHTLGGEAKILELHIERINSAARDIFALNNPIDTEPLRGEITSFLKANRAPQGVSVYLRLELYADGTFTLSIEEVSIYSGYTLRCFEPTATIIHHDVPYGCYSSAAREHIANLERTEAQRVECDIALRCNSKGEITAANNSSIFGVRWGVIYSSQNSIDSAEKAMVHSALEELFEVVDLAIMASQIETYDELFYADHYGITSIKNVGKRLYMNSVANSVARAIANF